MNLGGPNYCTGPLAVGPLQLNDNTERVDWLVELEKTAISRKRQIVHINTTANDSCPCGTRPVRSAHNWSHKVCCVPHCPGSGLATGNHFVQPQVYVIEEPTTSSPVFLSSFCALHLTRFNALHPHQQQLQS